MIFRLAEISDLPQIKSVFKVITENMNKKNGQIWDDFYPCEFFEDDILNKRLYVLMGNDVLVSAFALWTSEPEKYNSIQWENENAKAQYFGRFGVNVHYQGKGIGSIMLNYAKSVAKNNGFEYLRIFVVDKNKPAAGLYSKNGLKKAEGMYIEKFESGLVLNQYGYEYKLNRFN